MVATGYSDTFNRTVSNGLGTATSGQAYTLSGTATQFSVAPSAASIAISATGDNIGYVDLQTLNVDLTVQVALSALPATNQSLAGLIAKLADANNYYGVAMMVSSAGAVSLRFFKRVAGTLTTISTTLITGLTYVANTFYSLRLSAYWSQPLQTNVLSAKLWLTTATQPGGWQATAQDAGLTSYTAGTRVGIIGRDEAAAVGSVTAKFQSLATTSYNLPMPAGTDPMCYDPAVTYPRQTALQSLAAAADTAMAALDPVATLAASYPRVRVSNSNVAVNTSAFFVTLTYSTTEFNVGTSTNLSYDNTAIYLPTGIWLITFEIQLAEAPSDYINVFFQGGSLYAQIDITMRSNAAQSNDQGVGGCGHASALTVSTDPTRPIVFQAVFEANNSATTYNITYMALTAIKISDYFS